MRVMPYPIGALSYDRASAPKKMRTLGFITKELVIVIVSLFDSDIII